jgi:uncharacterized protein with WD repeat
MAGKGKKKNGKEEKAPKSVAVAEVAKPATVVGAVAGGRLETEKKLRKLQKKMDQIADLKDKQRSGAQMELTQIQKIGTEGALMKEIAEVQAILDKN